jgi:hypothetical protein
VLLYVGCVQKLSGIDLTEAFSRFNENLGFVQWIFDCVRPLYVSSSCFFQSVIKCLAVGIRSKCLYLAL